jgi:hypothetical protein
MIAAIYARKSTEQAGVADEQKSVAGQVGGAQSRPEVGNMNWYEGQFGQTKCQVSVRHEGEAWFADAFTVETDGSIQPVEGPPFPGSSEEGAKDAAGQALARRFGPSVAEGGEILKPLLVP